MPTSPKEQHKVGHIGTFVHPFFFFLDVFTLFTAITQLHKMVHPHPQSVEAGRVQALYKQTQKRQ